MNETRLILTFLMLMIIAAIFAFANVAPSYANGAEIFFFGFMLIFLFLLSRKFSGIKR